tara:strand:- start:166 stop:501 length:336 start_codon:yes stop_codon:yes gene_type:complete
MVVISGTVRCNAEDALAFFWDYDSRAMMDEHEVKELIPHDMLKQEHRGRFTKVYKVVEAVKESGVTFEKETMNRLCWKNIDVNTLRHTTLFQSEASLRSEVSARRSGAERR